MRRADPDGSSVEQLTYQTEALKSLNNRIRHIFASMIVNVDGKKALLLKVAVLNKWE